MGPLTLALSTFLATFAYADDWACKTQSSIQSGNTILACGIGIAEVEQVARDRALTSAMTEFQRICSASITCRPYESVAIPRRTDCNKTTHGFECVRAIEFIISSIPKKSILVDPTLLEREIEEKRKALESLQNQARLQEESKILEDEIARAKFDLARLDGQAADVSSPTPQYHVKKRSSFWGLGLEVVGSSIKNTSITSLMVNGLIEKRPIASLGIQGRLGYKYGIGGERYSAANAYEHSLGGLEFVLGIPVYFENLILKPEGGIFFGSYTKLSPSGTGSIVDKTNLTSDTTSLSQPFYGGSIGYQWSTWSAQAGYKKYQDSNGLQGNGTVFVRVEWIVNW